jgi:hypothetical protein
MRPSLHHHLTHDHGRAWRDLDGLPLEAMHRFEHVEQTLGLIDLDHWHARDGKVRRGRSDL